MMAVRHHSPQSGFTLVEVLAAFAIAAFVIMGVGTLVHHVAFSFDRGTAAASDAERFAMAMDRLAQDFAAARFVSLNADSVMPDFGGDGQRRRPAAFSGEAGKILFVSGGRDGRGAELVALSVEPLDGSLSQLVRRRGRWLGPATGTLDDPTGDAVLLLKGRYAISFGFEGNDGAADRWTGRAELPRLVRLTLRDRATGAAVAPGAEFVIRADAPFGCVSAKPDCLSSTAAPGVAGRRAP